MNAVIGELMGLEVAELNVRPNLKRPGVDFATLTADIVFVSEAVMPRNEKPVTVTVGVTFSHDFQRGNST